jgi:hypothetical protein
VRCFAGSAHLINGLHLDRGGFVVDGVPKKVEPLGLDRAAKIDTIIRISSDWGAAPSQGKASNR